MAGDESTKCGLCHQGKEIEDICGKLYENRDKKIAAHKMCMQYSADLWQFKTEHMEFGKFDPEKVESEIKRGKRLVCTICAGPEYDKSKKNKKKLAAKSWMKGATAGCAWGKCGQSFHVPCLLQNRHKGYLKKRIRKAYDDGDIEIQYKVFCSKEHLTRDLQTMEKDKKIEGYNFTTDSKSDSEDNHSDDNSLTSAKNLVKKTKTKKGKSSVKNQPTDQERRSPSPQQEFSDESDFDMESSQPYPSQTPGTSKKAAEASKDGNKKQTGETKQVYTRRKLENSYKPSQSQSSNVKPSENSVTGTQQPNQAHEGRHMDSDPDSGTNSSDDDSESLLEIEAQKKKKLTKKRTKGTKSPLVPHAKSSNETPVKRSRSTSIAKTPKSANKTLVRLENQPRITGFLSDNKPVRNLNLDDVNNNNKDAQDGSLSPSKYHTVTMGDNEMFLCNTDSQGTARIVESPEASTSKTQVVHKEADSQIGPVHGQPTEDASDSDIEVLEVKAGEVTADNQEISALKRSGSYIEQPETKRVKIEPESHDADSTTVTEGTKTKTSETVSHVAPMSDDGDPAFVSDASVSDTRSPSPVISSVMGAEDYILVVTESLITDSAKGLELAIRVHEATGRSVPLNRIIFWRHDLDDSYNERQMQYRLLFMGDLSKNVLCKEGLEPQKLHEYIFIKPFRGVKAYVDSINDNAKYLSQQYGVFIDNVREMVTDCVNREANNWKARVIKPDAEGDKIVLLVHVGDDLDPNSLVRKYLTCTSPSTLGIFKWQQHKRPGNFVATEMTRYYSLTELKMTGERSESTEERSKSMRGGYSVYVDASSLPDWWKDAETNTLYDKIDAMTNCKLTIYKKPDDKILRSCQQDSVTNKIERKLKSKKEQGTSDCDDSGSQSVEERAVLVMVPVKKNVINMAEYMKECIPAFCEKELTANNGKEVVIVCDTQQMSNEDLAQLVHELYEALTQYDVSFYTGVEPSKGPVTCLCLHVSFKYDFPTCT